MSAKSLTTKQAMRYSRHISLMGFDLDKQECLLNSQAMIIGMGGLGCAVAQYLVASGLGGITIVDDDHVDITNLQRQVLHFEDAVGISKVESAKRVLNSINSEVQINEVSQRLSFEQLQKLALQHQVIVDCSDNIETRNLLNRVCYQTQVPLVSGAAIRMEGQLFCVVPKQNSACYACISHLFGEQNLSCVESGVMSPLVGTIGAMQAIESIKIITDFGKAAINQLQVYDAMVSTWSSFNVSKLEGCKVCGTGNNAQK